MCRRPVARQQLSKSDDHSEPFAAKNHTHGWSIHDEPPASAVLQCGCGFLLRECREQLAVATGTAVGEFAATRRRGLARESRARGFEVIASQHGLDSHAGDVANVKRTLGRVSNPAILVGHSYGGSVITAAGTDPRVAGLVYLAAFAPDAHETTQSLQEKFPATEIFSRIEVADGRVWLKREGVSSFAGDLPEEEQKLIWATHAAPVADLFNQKVEGTAWRSKPSWYIVASEDRTIQPELERFVAKRMGATTFETDSSHVPMLSQPDFVLDVIRTAATAVQKSKVA
jgi:pimeloyl-ACP methyl ester carboxylesterase